MSTEDHDNDRTPEESADAARTRRLRGRPKYNIDRTALAQWIKAQRLSPEDKAMLFWLHDWASNLDLDLEAIGKRLKQPNGKPYSRDSVYQSMTGRRDASTLRNFIDAIADLRKLETERAGITRTGFIETGLTRRIFDVCDATRNFGKMGFLIGETHIGKTTPLMEYESRNNHGTTIYTRMPSSGARSHFIRRLAQRMRQSVTGNDHTIITNLHGVFDSDMLLIIDEFHSCLPRTDRQRKTGATTANYNTIECIRELHDVTGVPILLVVTPAFDEAIKDPAFERVLKQTMQRSLITCRLPDRATKEDLACFAKHFGLPRATGEALDLQNQVISQESLGRWLTILQGASKIASNTKQPIAWDHVLQSHAVLLSLENGR